MLINTHLAGFGVQSDYVKVPTIASLAHFNGSDTQTTTTDSAQGTISLAGGGSYIYLTTGAKKYGTTSLRIDTDASAWGRANWSARSDFIFPSDFTVEFWARQKTGYIYSRYGYLMTADGDDNLFQISSDTQTGDCVVQAQKWGCATADNVGFTLATASFTHVAIVRKDGTVKVYQDGTSTGSFASSGTLNPSGLGFRVGGIDINNLWHGYLDDFRVYKDYAVYSANFTPPAAEL